MTEDKRSRLSKMKAKLKSVGLLKRRKFILLKCVICDKHFNIRTNLPEIYTEHVINRWMCQNCKRK